MRRHLFECCTPFKRIAAIIFFFCSLLLLRHGLPQSTDRCGFTCFLFVVCLFSFPVGPFSLYQNFVLLSSCVCASASGCAREGCEQHDPVHSCHSLFLLTNIVGFLGYHIPFAASSLALTALKSATGDAERDNNGRKKKKTKENLSFVRALEIGLCRGARCGAGQRQHRASQQVKLSSFESV